VPATTAKAAKPAAVEDKRAAHERHRSVAAQRKQQQQIVTKLERQIDTLEQRQAAITKEMEEPATYHSTEKSALLNREFQHNVATLATLAQQWEAAATKLEALGSS
jgi:hypothetical protein